MQIYNIHAATVILVLRVIIAVMVLVLPVTVDIIALTIMNILVPEIHIQRWKGNRHVKLAPVIRRMQMNSIFTVPHAAVVRLLLKIGYVSHARLVNMQILNTQNVSLVMMEQLARVFVCLCR